MAEPRSGDRELVNRVRLITSDRYRPSGARSPFVGWPKARKASPWA